MTAASPDCELVSAYAAHGSEAAFRALVQRHVDLVYATALRQVGNTGLAEEITQNVFVALACKAPRLGGVETLAGWLHRAAVLESKSRIRSELRRRRREEVAVELGQLQREGASPFAAMIPLVDEALLSLREGDRLALMLRFLEDRSLREVGAALGVNEDAARKRVSRALERLNAFFRSKGFTTGTAAGGAAVLANAAKAAPAGLAISASNAGLAAGGASTGLNLLLFNLMALTKTQTIVLCAVIAATPLAWQSHAQARVTREQAQLNTQLVASNRQAADLEKNLARTRETLRVSRGETATNELRLAALNARLDGHAPIAAYHWDDSSPVARVPKQLLAQLPIGAVSNQRGHLTEQIKEVLQLNDAETEGVQDSIDRFLATYHAAQASKMRRVDPNDSDLSGRNAAQTRVFEMTAIGDRFGELRATFFGELENTLGPERSHQFKAALAEWMPTDDENHGLNSGLAVFNFDRRVRFYQPRPGNDWLDWSVGKNNGEGYWTSIPLDDIPEMFRADLQDWITLARSQPTKN